MDKNVCSNFIYVTTNLEYDSNNKDYKFKEDEHLKNYCISGCDNNLEKINAGCLYLLYTFFGSSDLFQSVAKSNTNIVDYIIIWLSYMLSLMDNELKESLGFFYKTYIIGGDKYKNTIADISEYNSYMELITKNHDLTNVNMNKNIISELYDAFKLLCEMYTEFNENTSNCTKCSGKADQFVKKYEKLKNDSSIAKNSSYSKVLCTLSTDYDNLKNKCKNFPLFPEINTTQNSVKCSENILKQISEDASSSSSITNKLLLVLSIFGAIGIFLGISYKYSLFGFRKRAQKQHLREKLKNIKKKMNY
ncbi:PIR protein [Plasmodium yoelii]|uniref:PIR protein n=2 Tax=Plasmodium yoelii TaxID=5861 RepID=A0AAE9WUP7_PLAYO|nr:PIR protein [Plasmodium yoelii]WBY60487.1 PIR protein [Plasmodium yoelii yoelii]VTZ81095.1 PIR protein [Plasmodium yoelii]|eukprot:XP_022813787.1 PIR protein [Plasmodium yoelii]